MKDRIKHFDYKLFELEEKAKTFLLVLMVFIIGFLIGYWCKNAEYEDEIYKQKIEIIDLREQVDRARYENRKEDKQ